VLFTAFYVDFHNEITYLQFPHKNFKELNDAVWIASKWLHT